MTAPVVLRRPTAELPPAAHAAITTDSTVLFVPLQRTSPVPTVIAATFFGAPAAAILVGCLWLIIRLSPGLPVILGVGSIAVLCVVVLGAQLFRLRFALRYIQAERRSRHGDEGLYRSGEWLVLVRSSEDVSLLPRSRIQSLCAVRVRYLRESFCTTYPCAVLDDGSEVLMRPPQLQTDETLGELLSAWSLPVTPGRVEVTDRELGRFLHL
ncbi:MAG: hypothetical protein ACI8S6_000124 [Myxococcota bacterium]|jgi:hypothetical protein